MDLESITLSEISQSDLTYMWNLINKIHEQTKQKQTRWQRTNWQLSSGRGFEEPGEKGEGIKQKIPKQTQMTVWWLPEGKGVEEVQEDKGDKLKKIL